MKHISVLISFFWIAILALVACRESTPPPSSPNKEMALDKLKGYALAYCWQDPSGRQSETSPNDKEVMIVVVRADGSNKSIIRDKDNLPGQHLSDYFIYKLGCVANGNDVRYIGNVLSWRPGSNEITYSAGSSAFLTDFDSRRLIEDFVVQEGDNSSTFGDYQKSISEPRGVYWSPDGKRFATIGRDLFIPGSAGDNIWVRDLEANIYVRITNFSNAGDLITNAGWSANGAMLAVEYGNQSGIGIAHFENDSLSFQYIEVTSLVYSELDDYWPYAFRSIGQLLYDQNNIDFNRYVTRTSIPVWVNNDQQIIFAASDKSGQGTMFVVNSDGTGLRQLMPEMTGLIFMPTLSPDGETLAFVRYPSWRDKRWVEISTVDITTLEVRSLVVLSAPKNKETLLISGMNWSLDGKYLAFSSNHEGESDVYILSADGSSWFNLTEDITGNAVSPTWKP